MKLRVKDYRRAMVVLVGGFHLVIGSAQVLSAPSRSTGGGFAWLPTHLDADELGWLWIVAGLTMLGCAWRWKGWADRLAFSIGTPVPTAWALIFLVSWAFYDNPTGLRSALIYAMPAGILLLLAAWPNPVEIESDDADD